ncbi:MAG: hypothetical protein C0504_03155 [Candidatus Solibacter sp.]|nr:hypothetical protein [Candidatus Solibacter sp.]
MAMTGARGGLTCNICHSGTNLNAGGGSLKVEIIGAGKYTPGAKHTLRVTLADPTAERWGFQLTAQLSGAAIQAGTLNLVNPSETVKEEESGLEYVAHRADGTRPGQRNQVTWDVDWIAPPQGAGNVAFFVAGNAANRNGNEFGDKIYTASAEYAADSGDTQTRSYALPQIAFGGNANTDGKWTTTLYFTSTATSATAFTVDFFANNGSPMPVPFGGGTATSIPVNLTAGSTTAIELSSSGALTQGWAAVNLPSTVKGFGIFRQDVTGRSPSEAVIPLAEDSKQNYVMVWDDTEFTTVMAIANPGGTPVTVNLTVRLANGNQIGTGAVNLGPKEKTAFVLRTQLNLPAMQGASGALDISVSSGKLSVLGLRFGPTAVTSMPPAER